jgi:hypothetical protein
MFRMTRRFRELFGFLQCAGVLSVILMQQQPYFELRSFRIVDTFITWFAPFNTNF